MKKINELFAIPIGLEPITIFGNMKLYTSESLKKSYIKSMANNDKLSASIDKISKLINNGIIIPCFLTKGIISTILFKMFPVDKAKNDEQFFREEMRNVFGFYDSGSKKIYILINNQINIFGYSNNNKLATITTHESSHMVANKNPSKFISYFNDIIFNYYNIYFSNLFKLNGNYTNEIVNIIRFLFNRFEKSKRFEQKDIKDYRNILYKLKKYSNDKNFENILHDFILTILLFTKSTSLFIKSINKFEYILKPLDDTYRYIFGDIDYKNIAIQELLFPSEIIAIGSEIGNQKDIINKIFNLL